MEFWKKFTNFLSQGRAGERFRKTFESLFAGQIRSNYKDTARGGSSVVEQFLGRNFYSSSGFADDPDGQADIQADATSEIGTLENSIHDYCERRPIITRNFEAAPPVFVIGIKNWIRDVQTGSIATVSYSESFTSQVLGPNIFLVALTVHLFAHFGSHELHE
jgi:hypothetical protein